MQWSKLKKRVEQMFAESVRSRVEIWSTRYRGAHDAAGEVWLTIDGKRVHSMATITHYQELSRRSAGRTEERMTPEGAQRIVDDVLSDGHLAQWDAHHALFEYLNLSIEDALQSECPLTRSLAMIDRRLGNRRLRKLDMEGEVALVRDLYDFRCSCEVQSSSAESLEH